MEKIGKEEVFAFSYLFTYNSFQSKLKSLRKKQDALFLKAVAEAEHAKADLVRGELNKLY